MFSWIQKWFVIVAGASLLLAPVTTHALTYDDIVRGQVLGVTTAPVVWTGLSDASVDSFGGITKTGGCDGCSAGGYSTQSITSGDASFEFTGTAQASQDAWIGFSSSTSMSISGAVPSLAYSIHISDYKNASGQFIAEVREAGVYKTEFVWVSGDLLSISLRGGVVTYARNGVTVYTSTAVISYPLYVKTALLHLGSTVGQVKLTSGATSPVSPVPPVAPPPPTVTPPAPTPVTLELLNIGIGNVTTTSATVSWVTTLPADSYVRFGTTTRMSRVARNTGLVTNHSFSLTSLLPNSIYYYQVRSKAGSLSRTSAVASFKTLSSTSTPPPTPVPPPAPTPPPVPTSVVDGYIDTFGLSALSGWFFSQKGDTQATITYVNTATNQTYTQTATRSVSRTDAAVYLSTTYGTSLPITQPLGFSVVPSQVLTLPGTYKIQSVILNASQFSVQSGSGAQGTVTIASQTPPPSPIPPPPPSPVPPVTTAAACVGVANGTDPECPRVYINSAVSATPSSGNVINVAAGGNLQTAINNACLGDTIVVAAGATYVGNFVIPVKTCGTGWLTVRTSNMAGISPEGVRIQPSQAGAMPKLLTPNTDAAITIGNGATKVRLIGLELGQQTSVTNGLLRIGNGIASTSQLPDNIVVDRLYIHGSPTTTVRRCIQLSSATTAIVDSYLGECHEKGADSQAIAGWEGSGPYKIVNNFLEGAGENILFGGGDPAVSGLVPSDIEIRSNYVFKQPGWQSSSAWTVKNLFELKNARRVLVTGNVFEHNWADGQAGSAILFTPRNQDGTAPWSVVSDIVFSGNIVRDTESGINLLDYDNVQPGQISSRILVTNNLFTGVRSRLLQMIDGGKTAQNIVYSHNTMLHAGTTGASVVLGDANIILNNSAIVNNIFTHGDYGFIGGGVGQGTVALNTYTTNTVLTKNAFIAGGNAANYPVGNYFPTSLGAVGFVNYGSDYSLSSGSPYKNVGTDGKDLGADFAQLNAATARSITGQ